MYVYIYIYIDIDIYIYISIYIYIYIYIHPFNVNVLVYIHRLPNGELDPSIRTIPSRDSSNSVISVSSSEPYLVCYMHRN
jgi:hypothetical protein